ncbi:HAMP domain-containing protein [candidate division KSB1 bacterium]|nr:HAMP domain-containing protein [candidate division KSB1 bacterium]
MRNKFGRNTNKNESAQLTKLMEALEALRKGDLSIRLDKETEDIFGQIADSYNQTVDQLSVFSSEVIRVAREVGIEGKLGGKAEVPGVSGIWEELTGNVNILADNLTTQIRNIAEVTTAVAQGDLSKKITVEVKGEILDLKSKLGWLEEKIAKVKATRESDSMLKSFLLSKRAAVENLNRVIYSLPPKEKKDLIEGLVEGDIEIGDGEGDGEKWQIVRMPLVFKPEAFKGLLGG